MVNKAYAIRDEYGNSKGFGYVCFEHISQAAKVINLKVIKILDRYLIECLPYDKTPAHQVASSNQAKLPRAVQDPHFSVQTGNIHFQSKYFPQQDLSYQDQAFHPKKKSFEIGPQILNYQEFSSPQHQYQPIFYPKKVLKSHLVLELSRMIELNSRGSNLKFNRQDRKVRKAYQSKIEMLQRTLTVNQY